MTYSNFNNKVSAGWKKRRSAMYLASFRLVILLGLTAGIVLSTSFSFSFASSSPSSSHFPYIPGLGPVEENGASSNNIAAIMGQINNVTNLRTYGSTAFGISIQYPAVWGAVELKSSPLDRFPGSSIASIIAPLENVTDTFREKALLSIQDFGSAGNMTLAKYTNGSLNAYRNISDSVTILESNATYLAGLPAHRIVFTEEIQNQQFKKAQVWTVKDNKAYVITLSAQATKYDDYLPSNEIMINSLKINVPQVSNATHTFSVSNATHTFSEDSVGIQMQYPSDWSRVQPGAPLDERKFAILVSFISPPTYVNSVSVGGNDSVSFSRVNIGIHDLRPSGADIPNNITLEEYSAMQFDSISRQGVNMSSLDEMALGDLMGHSVSYTHGNNNDEKKKQTLRIWTLQGDKTYHFIYTADSQIFSQYLPTAQNMANSFRVK
jgi:hypothetical protein